MTNRERLHKVLDLKGISIQSINQTLTQVSRGNGKNKKGYLKCVTDDEIAEGLIDGVGNQSKGLIGFMIFVPKSDFVNMYIEEKKEGNVKC